MSLANIETLLKRIHKLDHALSFLKWDEAVMMPAGGAIERAEVIAELAGLIHQNKTNPELEKWIGEAEHEVQDPTLKLGLKEWKKQWIKNKLVPVEFIDELTRIQILSESAWRTIRPKNDWNLFLPHFEKLFKLTKQYGDIVGNHFGVSAYDVMVDEWNPGLRCQDIDRLFEELKSFLPELIEKVILEKSKKKFRSLKGHVPLHRQKGLSHALMEKMGFDFKHGRLDETHHPFCGGVPTDVRVTTRYEQDDLIQGLMSVIHETGHGFYEQNLPQRWAHWPVGRSRGMMVHESQSLFFEMQIGRSREFAKFLMPLLKTHLGADYTFGDLSAEELFENVTEVQKSYIRIYADEVTYPCHVILRYEIERMLFNNELSPKEIPEVWNAKMQKYLGLSTIGNDKDGCLQDVHWPAGIFGYFPSYALGSLMAAQLMEALEKQFPEIRSNISDGHFSTIRDWLNNKIWSKGSLVDWKNIITESTGSDLSAQPFRRHIEKRYLL